MLLKPEKSDYSGVAVVAPCALAVKCPLNCNDRGVCVSVSQMARESNASPLINAAASIALFGMYGDKLVRA